MIAEVVSEASAEEAKLNESRNEIARVTQEDSTLHHERSERAYEKKIRQAAHWQRCKSTRAYKQKTSNRVRIAASEHELANDAWTTRSRRASNISEPNSRAVALKLFFFKVPR